MSVKMPVQLGNSPLLEAIFEMRFESEASAAGELLPGLLYPAMKVQYPKIVPLAAASIPREIRERQPQLLYQPSIQLTAEFHSVQVGDRVLSVRTNAYPGWRRFKEMVEFALVSLKGTDLVRKVERFSFKYVNIIEASESEKQLGMLNAHIELTGSAPIERGFRLRVERDDAGFVTIIEIIPNSKGKSLPASKEVLGLLVTVDTIKLELENQFWSNRTGLIEDAHSVAKSTFYSLLTDSTIERLKPIW